MTLSQMVDRPAPPIVNFLHFFCFGAFLKLFWKSEWIFLKLNNWTSLSSLWHTSIWSLCGGWISKAHCCFPFKNLKNVRRFCIPQWTVKLKRRRKRSTYVEPDLESLCRLNIKDVLLFSFQDIYRIQCGFELLYCSHKFIHLYLESAIKRFHIPFYS